MNIISLIGRLCESPEDLYDWWTEKNKRSQDESADQMKLMEDDDG